MKNGYNSQRDIIFIKRMPSPANAVPGECRSILSILLYILKYFQFHTAHNNLWIYPKFSNFIYSYPLQLTNLITYRDIRKPLKFPALSLRWEQRRQLNWNCQGFNGYKKTCRNSPAGYAHCKIFMTKLNICRYSSNSHNILCLKVILQLQS